MAPSETGTIFEEIGWEYIGPVDGHDVVTLLDIFRNIRELRFPVFVHAITVKGKGYDVAETDARKWHGVIPFDLESGTMAKAPGPITYTQAFGSAAVEAAEQDDQIIAITAAMPDGTGLTEFARKFPERYHDVGIAEPHAVTFAAGLAAGGMKPFCAIYSTFLQRAFDQILHDVCLQHLPVRFFLDRAGLVGDDGPTHHGSFDLSYLSLMPGLTILAPRDATELGEMVRWMKDFNQGPSVVRYPRGTSDDRLPEFRTPVQFGRAEVLTPNLARYDALLLSIGSTVSTAWQVFQDPRLKGSKLGVVNLRFAKPLDWECILDLSQRSRWVITIEENSPSGGIGQHIASKLAQIESFRGGVKCFSLPDEFVDHGNIDLLKRDIGLNADRITSEVESLIRA
jgi:1-deoxy-D-xylulose-5-phosphate synthase